MTTTNHRVRARVAAAVLGTLALTGAMLVATPQSGLTSQASADKPEKPRIPAVCDEDETSDSFGGAKVSAAYDLYFDQSQTSTDHFLDNYTPQGLGMWENWRGGPGTEDLFLVGMHYSDDPDTEENEEETNRGLLYGMDAAGNVQGYAMLPEGSHAGGVKVHKGWVYVQKNNKRILRYPVERIREAFTDSSRRELGGGTPTASVTDVSFFDIDGGYLYGGFHNKIKDRRGRMFRYEIQPDGDLIQDTQWGPIEIPTKAQGVLVLSDTWIFSTSRFRDYRGNIYVVRRGYESGEEFTSVKYKCFQSVAMTQELVGHNGTTYLLNESGAAEFEDGRIDDIRNLHVANTETLRSLVW
ncbi:hypothetical protein V6K52_17945 [Knoellia sp. S7-12]|uniref:hypothetical protein n=1 Tax=Knoellia sp. S7-12 TaxID=3126698 RepID=UPI00336843BE